MKFLIVLAAVMTSVFAVSNFPLDDSKAAKILSYDNENIGVGGYKFAYATSDGVSRTEEAELKNIGSENEALVVRGRIDWIGANDQAYTLTFVADENGYQPSGIHLPDFRVVKNIG